MTAHRSAHHHNRSALAPPARRSRLTRALALTATITAGLLALPAIAAATVDENSPAFSEPAGPVYTLQNTFNSANGLLQHHGNAPAAQTPNGAAVTTWSQLHGYYQDPDGAGPRIVQANEQWEFEPASDNPGGKLTTGYGHLINRQSGKCLEVNGNNPADFATVDQWDCGWQYPNEEWTAIRDVANTYLLRNRATGTYLNVPCNQNAGTAARTVTQASLPLSCSLWNPKPVSYSYATHKQNVNLAMQKWDESTYGCRGGYWLRSAPWDGQNWDYHFADLSEYGVDAQHPSTLDYTGVPPNRVESTGIQYYYRTIQNSQYTRIGQMLLFCDPESATP